MLERLKYLKIYIQMMGRENLQLPPINLSIEQWMILEDILLAPFINVQQMMEGEEYVTVSLIPGIFKLSA
jgi:hypothetical protein